MMRGYVVFFSKESSDLSPHRPVENMNEIVDFDFALNWLVLFDFIIIHGLKFFFFCGWESWYLSECSINI